MSKVSIVLALAMTLAACTETAATTTTSTAPTTAAPATSQIAEAYISEALALMQAESLASPHADWLQIEQSVRSEAEGAILEADTYLALELGLRLLNDPWGVFVTPEDVFAFQNDAADIVEPTVEVRDGQIGYIAPGQFLGDPSPEADEFSADLASAIVAVEPDVCGWLLDLRVARLGIPEPILGGLTPVFDEGALGGIVDVNGEFAPLESSGGDIFLDGEVLASSQQGIRPETRKPIAVMIGSLTGIPGEVSAIALRGQADTTSFGQPTAGFGLWIEAFEMSDGAVIALATGELTDRLGESLQGGFPMFPEVPTENPGSSEAAALEWLTTHPSCQ